MQESTPCLNKIITGIDCDHNNHEDDFNKAGDHYNVWKLMKMILIMEVIRTMMIMAHDDDDPRRAGEQIKEEFHWVQIQVDFPIPGSPFATEMGGREQCCTCIANTQTQTNQNVYQRIQAALLRAMERNIFLCTDILNVTLEEKWG